MASNIKQIDYIFPWVYTVIDYRRRHRRRRTTRFRLVSYFLFFTGCDVICDTHTGKCSLFVNFRINLPFLYRTTFSDQTCRPKSWKLLLMKSRASSFDFGAVSWLRVFENFFRVPSKDDAGSLVTLEHELQVTGREPWETKITPTSNHNALKT